MSDFPSGVYAPRTKANRPGVVYDPDNLYAGYAEDVTKLDDEVVAIEEFLQQQNYRRVGPADAHYITDGVADQVQINAAISEVSGNGGGIVEVMAGIYYIDDVIKMYSNVWLKGVGIDQTTIKAIDNYDPATNDPDGNSDARVMVISGESSIQNIKISHFTFDGNVQNISGLTSNTHHRIVWIQGSSGSRGSNVIFRKNKVLNSINWAVYFQYINYLWIEENIVWGGYSSTYDQNDGIHVRNSSNVWINKNFVDNNKGGGTSGDDAIAVLSNAGTSGDTENIIISENILNGGTSGIDVGVVLTNHLRRVKIINNTIYHAGAAGIAVVKFTQNGVGRVKDILIQGNQVYDYSSVGGGGIRVVDKPGITIDETVFENLSIIGNHVENNIDTANTRGIEVGCKGTGLVVIGNSVTDFDGNIAAIMLGEASHPIKDAVVSNNRVDFRNASGIAGIQIYGIERGQVSGNVVYGSQTGTTYGILLKAKATAGNDNDGVANIEICKYLVINGNNIYNVVNGISEVNDGANPDYNLYIGNMTHNCTNEITIVGSNSVSVSGANLAV